MKRIIMLFALMALCFVGKAQYYHYDPDLAAENQEIRQLNNIRFNSDAFKNNPVVLNRYLEYLDAEMHYAKKRKVFDIIEYSGLGIMASALIPALCNNYGYYDSRCDKLDNLAIGLLIGGTCTLYAGVIGSLSMNNHLKNNKREMIYYLKVNNGGVGIVSIF